jgi:hypothetical protein
MSVADIIGGPDRVQHPWNARGRVEKAPALSSDSLEVLVLGQSSDQLYSVPPGQWQPHGSTLPTVGVTCLVQFDHHGDAWVTMWVEP